MVLLLIRARNVSTSFTSLSRLDFHFDTFEEVAALDSLTN